jgi:hypothetical protein
MILLPKRYLDSLAFERDRRHRRDVERRGDATATCAANYLEASNAAAETETAATKTAETAAATAAVAHAR